jgi:TatD DNase family protein
MAVGLAQNQQNCWASVGIHPHEATQHLKDPQVLEQFTQLLQKSERINLSHARVKLGHSHKNVKGPTFHKIVAVGEIGLDYYYNYSPKADQIKILEFQLDLAQKHDLPCIFHVREAFDDFWPVFDRFKGIRGVLHSFTDNQANLDKALTRGLYIGVNGIATFAREPEKRVMYVTIPQQRLLLETDAPFLTPAPYRSIICQPKHVRVTAEFLAGLRDENLEQLAKVTTQNACDLFSI